MLSEEELRLLYEWAALYKIEPEAVASIHEVMQIVLENAWHDGREARQRAAWLIPKAG